METLHDFEAANSDELELKKGDVVLVVPTATAEDQVRQILYYLTTFILNGIKVLNIIMEWNKKSPVLGPSKSTFISRPVCSPGCWLAHRYQRKRLVADWGGCPQRTLPRKLHTALGVMV